MYYKVVIINTVTRERECLSRTFSSSKSAIEVGQIFKDLIENIEFEVYKDDMRIRVY